MVKLTQKDIAIIAGAAGAVDFLTEGRLSAPVARAFKKAFARGAVRAPGTAVGVARGLATGIKFVAVRHPVATAGAIAYVAYKNREEIGDLVEQGYEIVQPAVSEARARARPILEQAAQLTEQLGPPGIQSPRILDPLRERLGVGKAPRRKSPFNKAVGAGMKAVKASTSFGKKGVINSPRKAFTMVTRVASMATKKRKAPKKGIRRKVWTAVRKFIR
jgi:hypothetical protein